MKPQSQALDQSDDYSLNKVIIGGEINEGHDQDSNR